ncbi:MAG: circadian clock protein KaiA [Acaryochloridaceae cyanobacterium SU_2_1]|nr:circadian clock protein KaiA [Acaryochloridaceae cyanobacterium SU_2_1]
MAPSLAQVARPQLFICTLLSSESLVDHLSQILEGDRYRLLHTNPDDFLTIVKQGKHHIDCLILEETASLPQRIGQLHRDAILLPAVIVTTLPEQNYQAEDITPAGQKLDSCYHVAEVRWADPTGPQILEAIEQSISQFLQLSKTCPIPDPKVAKVFASEDFAVTLASQQQRLSQKLKERLGYLGVYYKRNPRQFFHQLSEDEKQEYLLSLKQTYQKIILNYFRAGHTSVNQQIDEFVATLFFSDISILKILEIHMELMSSLTKQLKLEGRDEAILLDYRLTLIDIMAHLCEMYRRSIPKAEKNRSQ